MGRECVGSRSHGSGIKKVRKLGATAKKKKGLAFGNIISECTWTEKVTWESFQQGAVQQGTLNGRKLAISHFASAPMKRGRRITNSNVDAHGGRGSLLSVLQ